MPSVALLVPVRNKEKHLTRLVESVFAQTYSPMEILLSDQGSTDGSRGLLANLARSYNGPNKVRTLDCPMIEYKGHLGLSAHFDWLHTQTDAEIITFACADDYLVPERTAKVVKAFEENDPSLVANGMSFTNEDFSEFYGVSVGSNNGSRWLTLEEIYKNLVGSSTAHSWTHEFYDKIGGHGDLVTGEDYVFPYLAALDKGAWFLDEQLYTYIRYADGENTGLEGVLRAAKSEAERMQLEELMHYQAVSAMYVVVDRMNKCGFDKKEGAFSELITHLLDRVASWQNTRNQMTLNRVTPIRLNV